MVTVYLKKISHKSMKLKFFILSRRRDRGSFITATDLYPLTFAPTYQPNATSIFLHKPLHPASSTKINSVYIKFPFFSFFFFLICWQGSMRQTNICLWSEAIWMRLLYDTSHLQHGLHISFHYHHSYHTRGSALKRRDIFLFSCIDRQQVQFVWYIYDGHPNPRIRLSVCVCVCHQKTPSNTLSTG